MKIVDIEIIPFRLRRATFRNRRVLQNQTVVETLTRVVTDQGAEGYCVGGQGAAMALTADEQSYVQARIVPLLRRQDPFDRERFWHWLWAMKAPTRIISVVDMALWDLQARLFGIPVYKLLGGCRDRVKAYASTYPNIGAPNEYAQHALDCRARGYRAYKIHPYYFADPVTFEPLPGRPSHVDQDIAACRAVREAVGDHMVLMFDVWGTYHSYQEALKVGRELERLGFYLYEHPMPEYRVQSYAKLAQELTIPILSPELAEGSLYTRADWILRQASDMSRIDVHRGGITGCHKLAAICEAYGIKCELHAGGWANLQILGATSEDVCEYYERGLEAPGLDVDAPPLYLKQSMDPMDSEGYVHLPQAPGIGYDLDWDYIRDNTIRGR
jgi:L-alanine-DL-glutamate epimerase-like enolase superfamily enzyme